MNENIKNSEIETELKKLGYWNDLYSKNNYFGTGPTILAIFAQKLIEKYSTAQIAAQARLAAVKARKKKLKREANEKALNRMVADARETYSTI